MLEAMDEMAIGEKEMKLLMNFVKDDLEEARDSEDVERKNIYHGGNGEGT